MVAVEREMPGLHFRTIREFHRCKAIEDVNQNAFEDIVDNLANIMGIEDNQKNEIKLAKHSQSMVNVIEDFEYGSEGFYTYGKYQTMRRPGGNMDLVFAIHAFKWQLEDDLETSELGQYNGKDGHSGNEKYLVSRREKEAWKSQFRWKKIQVEYIKAQLRSEAMRLFEADCPQQLITDVGLGKRRKRETGTKDQVGRIS